MSVITDRRLWPRCLWALIACTLLCLPALPAADIDEGDERDDEAGVPALQPLPPMPPLPREAPSIPRSEADERSPREREGATTPAQEPRAVDRVSLVADLAALRQDVSRVRRALEHDDPRFAEALRQEVSEQQRQAAPRAEGSAGIQPDGEPISSPRLGANSLVIQRYRLGDRPMPATVSARISGERVEVVYREMAFLLGQSLNDRELRPARRMVEFTVNDMPWEEALTRLLRQVNLAWRNDADSGQIVIYEPAHSDYQPPRSQWLRSGLQSLRAAARSGDDAIAAEARFHISQHDQDRARAIRQRGGDDSEWRALHYAAISGFADIIQEFDTGSRARSDALPWARKAMIGIGESMHAVGMHREAYSIYRNYIAKAERNDPELPRVMLAAANAAREQHRSAITGDISDLEIASNLLRDLIDRFANDPHTVATVNEARLELGRLYFQQGEYRAARQELLAHAAEAGAGLSHHLHFMIAESDVGIARQMRSAGDSQRQQADVHLGNAQSRLEGLAQALFHHATDPLLDSDLYRRALYLLGSVKIMRNEPDFVGALHVFLRARQRFPQSDIEGPLLIAIARCYAEIHASREHIDHMWKLLEADRLLDDREVQFQLSEMLQDLQVQAGAYPGPIKSRVHFYLAQYHYRVAEQNPAQGQNHYQRAVSLYQRVLGDQPPQYLAQAARLGLARAALASGDDARGVVNLREVLLDAGAHPRDKQLAAQILGDHYYRRGMYREAIEAYDGRPVQ